MCLLRVGSGATYIKVDQRRSLYTYHLWLDIWRKSDTVINLHRTYAAIAVRHVLCPMEERKYCRCLEM